MFSIAAPVSSVVLDICSEAPATRVAVLGRSSDHLGDPPCALRCRPRRPLCALTELTLNVSAEFAELPAGCCGVERRRGGLRVEASGCRRPSPPSPHRGPSGNGRSCCCRRSLQRLPGSSRRQARHAASHGRRCSPSSAVFALASIELKRSTSSCVSGSVAARLRSAFVRGSTRTVRSPRFIAAKPVDEIRQAVIVEAAEPELELVGGGISCDGFHSASSAHGAQTYRHAFAQHRTLSPR